MGYFLGTLEKRGSVRTRHSHPTAPHHILRQQHIFVVDQKSESNNNIMTLTVVVGSSGSGKHRLNSVPL